MVTWFPVEAPSGSLVWALGFRYEAIGVGFRVSGSRGLGFRVYLGSMVLGDGTKQKSPGVEVDLHAGSASRVAFLEWGTVTSL